MNHNNQKIAIIGGGIIGLSIAWQLRKTGAYVDLFEAGETGMGASIKAAGMISPYRELQFGEEKLLETFIESANLYPEFIKNIEIDAEEKIDFRQDGSLLVAIDDDDVLELQRFYDYQQSLNLPIEWWNREQVLKKIPHLNPNFKAASFCNNEASVDNRGLLKTLHKANLNLGTKIFEHSRIEDIWIEAGTCKGIFFKNEKQKYDAVILASGLTYQFPSMPKKLLQAIRPVKGQALCLKMLPGLEIVCVLRSIHRYPVYMVPRSNGELIIGATMEELSDENVTAGAVLDLLYAAWRLLPAVYEFPIVDTWAGLRPANNRQQPELGPTEVPGLIAAMGLYRHGFLLAPYVAKIITQLL